MIGTHGTFPYPVNYEKTLEQAKREMAVTKAIECIGEIENRWLRIIGCDEYTFNDIKKETLLGDISVLLTCGITLHNKIKELEALLQHRNPKKYGRIPKQIMLRKE